MEQTILDMGGPVLPAKLCILTDSKTLEEYPLKEHTSIGRTNSSTSVDLAFDSPVVSRNHGEISFTNGRYYYRDLQSSNGTYINEVLYGLRSWNGNMTKCLENGDVIRIGDYILLFLTDYCMEGFWNVQPFTEQIEEINIGRQARGSDIALTAKTVSRNHASFFRGRDGWAVIDHNSTNGVYLNNNRLEKPVYLNILDVIRIGRTNFIYLGNRLLYQGEPSAAQSDQLFINIVKRSVWQRFKKLTLLQDINLTVNNGEMVLILGGSGAGKTTFLNAVMGYEKADGTIRHGSTNIYTEYDRMKYEIGFVPQQDLLRGSDSVYDTLQNAAKMKLPKEISSLERKQRIEDVLELLGLQRERDSLVVKLSGGQRKRLSIAVEFISDPSLFFLDEPDSGLDGIMARSLMENLRNIADRGKIVMVITHGPDRAAELFDKVIVLAKSIQDNCGHLAFYGSVPEAYRFFETDSLEGVVRRINRPDEGGDGLSDYYIDLFNRRRI